MDHLLEHEVSTLHHEHGAAILRYAESLSGDSEMARDAVQEVFLRYFIERRYGRSIESPRAWLHRVLRNYLLDRLKAFAASRQAVPEVLESLPAREASPEEAVRDSEVAQQIAAILTSRELACLRLRAEGFSYVEIASAMAIRTGTVGALLARVQKKIQQAAVPPSKRGFLEIAAALPYLIRGTCEYPST